MADLFIELCADFLATLIKCAPDLTKSKQQQAEEIPEHTGGQLVNQAESVGVYVGS